MERRIAPSARIEDVIEAVLLDGISGPDELSQLGRLGAQLILQRARYERTETSAGSRNGRRPRRIQTAEGEITIAMPQVRDTPAGSPPARERSSSRSGSPRRSGSVTPSP